jgi:hypothetical protein
MAAQDDLWTAVVAAYPSQVLLSLSNPEDPAAVSINTAWGTAAALATIELWPVYAQAAYDSTDTANVQVGIRGTIAMLFERGGSSTEIAKIKWDDVFSDEGLIARLRKTNARSHPAPRSNSGTAAPSSELLSDGTSPLGWSDSGNLPNGILPTRRSSYRD